MKILTPEYTAKSDLVFDLYLTSRCNLKCSYCATWQEGYGEENGLGDIELSDCFKVLDTLVKLQPSKTKCLSILGGEPLLYKELNAVIDYAFGKFNELELYTNGTRPLEYIRTDELKTVVSIHPRFFNNKRKETVLENLDGLKSRGNDYLVKLMMEGDQNLDEVMSCLEGHPVVPCYIVNKANGFVLDGLTDGQLRYPLIQTGNNRINILEYIKKYYKNTSKYLCDMNAFTIIQTGDLIPYCGRYKTVNLFKDDLSDWNPKPVRCTHKSCTELGIVKYKVV